MMTRRLGQSNASRVRAVYVAMNAGDEAALAQCLADDFVFERRTESPQLPWLLLCRGRAETIAALRPTPAGQCRVVIRAIFDGGARVTAHVEITWESPAGPAGDSGPLVWRESHQWTFDEDGTATRLRQTADRVQPVDQPARVLPFVPGSPA